MGGQNTSNPSPLLVASNNSLALPSLLSPSPTILRFHDPDVLVLVFVLVLVLVLVLVFVLVLVCVSNCFFHTQGRPG